MITRPVFQVGVAGLDPRDVRLIDIVFSHGAFNPYDYRLLDVLDLTRIDILVANASESEGLDAIAATRSYSRHIPVVVAMPSGTQIAARHSLTIDRLTLQLLPILNRAVDAEGLAAESMPGRAVCADLTDIHPVGPVATEAADGAREAGATASVPIAVAASPARAAAAAGAAMDGVAVDGLDDDTMVDDRGGGPTVAAAARAEAVAPAPPAAWSAPPAAWSAPGSACGPMPASVRANPPGGWGAVRSDGAAAGLPGDIGSAGAVRAPRPRLQVLVADPSLAAQEQLATELRRLGHDVQCVVSGAAAGHHLSRHHFDLVVTESGLTDAEGFTLIHWMRRIPAYRTTPVLLLQRRSGWLDSTRARLDGHVTVLAKPVSRGRLIQLVGRALRQTLVVDETAGFRY